MSKLRHRILSILIAVNTLLFGYHLIVSHNLVQACMSLMTCIVCWIGIYVLSVVDRSKKKSLQGPAPKEKDEKDDEQIDNS